MIQVSIINGNNCTFNINTAHAVAEIILRKNLILFQIFCLYLKLRTDPSRHNCSRRRGFRVSGCSMLLQVLLAIPTTHYRPSAGVPCGNLPLRGGFLFRFLQKKYISTEPKKQKKNGQDAQNIN